MSRVAGCKYPARRNDEVVHNIKVRDKQISKSTNKQTLLKEYQYFL